MLELVKPKLTAGLVRVLWDLTEGLEPFSSESYTEFISFLLNKINQSSFESKAVISPCMQIALLLY